PPPGGPGSDAVHVEEDVAWKGRLRRVFELAPRPGETAHVEVAGVEAAVDVDPSRDRRAAAVGVHEEMPLVDALEAFGEHDRDVRALDRGAPPRGHEAVEHDLAARRD